MNPFFTLYGFKEEKEIDYNGEHYSVRDNGSVKRHPKEGQKNRKNDDMWTFGTASHDGYALIGNERIHRIVATAFHGEAPSPQHVVDHLDTNKKNNRPENLCWKTREENILTNEITKRKIEFRTGLPIKEVLKDISILHNLEPNTNYNWMRPVTEEESAYGSIRWRNWMDYQNQKSAILRTERLKANFIGFYLCHPPQYSSNMLKSYLSNLISGAIIYACKQFTTRVIEAELNEDETAIFVKCSSTFTPKPWGLYTITYHNYQIRHEYLSCFGRDSIEKYYNEALGREWTGGDVIDDFC